MKVPKLKGALFESAVIERYRRREQSVEESLIDMYLAGVSTRQVDDISQLLWGDRMPSQTLSDKLKRIYGEIDQWRTRPLESEYPYVFVDGVWHKRSWGGRVENVSVLVAIGINAEGHREVIGVTEGMREDSASWEQFFRGMIERGLKGVRLVVWRTRPLESEYPYVFVDGVWHKRSWGGRVENVSVLVAIGINAEGHREVIGVTEGMREDSASWEQFFRGMIERGLKGVRLVVGDRCAGLVATVGSMLPKAKYQRCMVHFMRNVLSKVPP
ncbi:hypothetical protein GA586_09440, partial [Bifidobacterium adolescentis]